MGRRGRKDRDEGMGVGGEHRGKSKGEIYTKAIMVRIEKRPLTDSFMVCMYS